MLRFARIYTRTYNHRVNVTHISRKYNEISKAQKYVNDIEKIINHSRSNYLPKKKVEEINKTTQQIKEILHKIENNKMKVIDYKTPKQSIREDYKTNNKDIIIPNKNINKTNIHNTHNSISNKFIQFLQAINRSYCFNKFIKFMRVPMFIIFGFVGFYIVVAIITIMLMLIFYIAIGIIG